MVDERYAEFLLSKLDSDIERASVAYKATSPDPNTFHGGSQQYSEFLCSVFDCFSTVYALSEHALAVLRERYPTAAERKPEMVRDIRAQIGDAHLVTAVDAAVKAIQPIVNGRAVWQHRGMPDMAASVHHGHSISFRIHGVDLAVIRNARASVGDLFEHLGRV